MRLSERTAIVTGGGREIGRGIVMEFARNGAKVCVVDILKTAIDSTVKRYYVKKEVI